MSITAFCFLISSSSIAAQGRRLLFTWKVSRHRKWNLPSCFLHFFLFMFCFAPSHCYRAAAAQCLYARACGPGSESVELTWMRWMCLEYGCKTLRCKTMVTGNWAESHLKYCHFAQTWDCLRTVHHSLPARYSCSPGACLPVRLRGRLSFFLLATHFCFFFFFIFRQQRQPCSRHTLSIHRLLWFI